MKPIKEYIISSTKQAAYIPILDEEPSFAAMFLTKKDLNKAHNLLIETFEEIKSNKPYHLPLYETILNSHKNFMWFAALFRKIERILNPQKKYRLSYARCPKAVKGEKLEVYQPFKSHNGKTLSYPKSNVKWQTPINNYRIQYIIANYSLEDFQDEQLPAWYLLKETTIYEEYNEKTNTRIRIDFRDGRLMYFIAGASDNWQLIDAPQEMDHIVSAFLFKHLID